MIHERLAVVETKLDDVRNGQLHLDQCVDELRRSITGRPSWAVTVYITLITAAASGLLAVVFTKS